jgi:hypothetical protein
MWLRWQFYRGYVLDYSIYYYPWQVSFLRDAVSGIAVVILVI